MFGIGRRDSNYVWEVLGNVLMFAVDGCRLPETGGSTFLVVAGLFLLIAGVLESENAILKEGFKNMGFDVKDMKNILDKLVEGVISKNEINVIK